MRAVNRCGRLTALLEPPAARGRLGTDEVAVEPGVSAATVRRDLDHPAEQRLPSRTHGGAVAQAVPYDLPMRCKNSGKADEKQRIGRAAANLAASGSVVGLAAHAERVVVVAHSSKLGRRAYEDLRHRPGGRADHRHGRDGPGRGAVPGTRGGGPAGLGPDLVKTARRCQGLGHGGGCQDAGTPGRQRAAMIFCNASSARLAVDFTVPFEMPVASAISASDMSP